MSVQLPLPNYIIQNEKGEFVEKASFRPDGSVRKQRKVRFLPFVLKKFDNDRPIESVIKVDEGYDTDSDSCRGSPTKDGEEIEIKAEKEEKELMEKDKLIDDQIVHEVASKVEKSHGIMKEDNFAFNSNDSGKPEMSMIKAKAAISKKAKGKPLDFTSLRIVRVPKRYTNGFYKTLSTIREQKTEEENNLTDFGEICLCFIEQLANLDYFPGCYWKELDFDYISWDEIDYFQFLLEEISKTFDVNNWNDQMQLAYLLILAKNHGIKISVEIC